MHTWRDLRAHKVCDAAQQNVGLPLALTLCGCFLHLLPLLLKRHVLPLSFGLFLFRFQPRLLLRRPPILLGLRLCPEPCGLGLLLIALKKLCLLECYPALSVDLSRLV